MLIPEQYTELRRVEREVLLSLAAHESERYARELIEDTGRTDKPVYTALQRLSDKGLITLVRESDPAKDDHGRGSTPRKYYDLTASGQALMHKIGAVAQGEYVELA